jgi:hypothetical protein
MSLRSTKSRIQGKIASGAFNQPNNTLADAIDTGAGIMAKGIMRQAEEKRLEEREAKKEKAAEARRLAAAQAKKEAEARKNQRIANSIALRFGIDPKNAQGMAYVTNEVEIHGTDAIGVIQKDFDDRKVNLSEVEVTEDFVTGASPNQAPPMRLPPNPDGSMRTTLDIGEAIDDLEATGSPAASAARSAAESRFSPQQLNKGEVQTETTTSQGFEFNPLAKDESVNIDDLKSLATMDSTERDNLALSLAEATDPELVAIREAIELMTAKEGADLSSYFTNITTPAAVEAKKLLVQNSPLSAEDKKIVLDQLETHLTKIAGLTEELKLTDQTFYADIKGEDGTVSTIELVAKEGGGFYSYALDKSFGSTDFETGTVISADNVKEIRSAGSQVQEKVVAPMNARRSDVTDLLRRAAAIDELVLQSDGKVLTFIGGKLPAIIKRISTEYTNLSGFVSGVENLSQEAYKISSTLEPENMPTAAELTELGISADQYSRFQAQAIEFAYVYARTAMGQERTTDKDFEAAFNVVVAGSDYATFTKSLRDLVNEGYAKAEQQHNLLLTHPSIKAAGMIPNSEKAFGDQIVPLADYLEGQDIQAQLQWMNTEYQAPASVNEPPASGEVTPLSVGQQVSKIKNLSGFPDFQSMYNNPRRSPEEKAILAKKIAEQYGVDSASVARALEQKVEQ